MKRLRVVLNLSGIGFCSKSKRVHSLIYKASINKSVSGFLGILIGYRNIHI